MRRARATLVPFSSLLTPTSLAIIFSIFTLSNLSFGAAQDRILTPIVSHEMVQLPAGVPLKAQPQFDQGAVDPALKLDYMTLLTVPSASQQKALDRLLAQQQDRKSPLYHKWLTPEQYANRFGLSTTDVQKITAWLQSQGFTVIHVAPSRNLIAFSGTAELAAKAFQTEIHAFSVEGETHFSNVERPSIPAALSGVISGIGGLNNFRPKPHAVRRHPDYTFSYQGFPNYVLAPGDIATTYDITGLYNLTPAIDGTGQTLAVIGETDIYLADINDFRAGFGLSTIPTTGAGSCTTDVNGVITNSSPGCNTTNFRYLLVGNENPTPSPGNLGEADIDIEWSGATARNAQIIYVNAPDPNGNGVWDAWQYAVTHNVAPVITMSYGLCELGEAQGGWLASDESFLQQANSQGITFVNSSGDAGSASCDLPSSLFATQGLAVSYPASSPEVTGVGGTMIPLGEYSSQYWNSGNGSDGGSIVTGVNVPENAWNDDTEIGAFCTVHPTNTFCKNNGIKNAQTAQQYIGMSAGGGGASNCTAIASSCSAGFSQPTWQQGLNVPGAPANARYVPDVSLLASPSFPGYVVCTPESEIGNYGSASTCSGGISSAVNQFSIFGGTSVSSPVFAGIVTLLNQYVVQNNLQTTPGLGNVNPNLYQIAKYNQSAFHHVTGGLNAPGGIQVYCQPGTPNGQPAALVCPAAVKPATEGLFGYLSANADSATGYNLATGLGSVDAKNLAMALGELYISTAATISTTTTSPVFQGEPVTFTVSVTPGTATGDATFFNSNNGSSGTILKSTPVSSVSGTSQATLTTTSLPAGTDSITAIYNGIYASSVTSNSAAVTVVVPNFTLTPSTATVTTTQGGTTPAATLTVTSNNGFVTNSATAVALIYTCSGLPSESSCIFSPGGTTNSAAPTVSVVTTARSAQLRPMHGDQKVFYAMFLPGMLGIVFALGSKKKSARKIRLLSLVLLSVFSSMWLGSCGGSSGNPGTPKGSYAVTINATTGTVQGTGAPFTLVVN